MSYIKAPTFEELVSHHGTPKKAIKYLAKHLSPTEIERRYTLSAHMVHVYLKGGEITTSIPFSEVSDFFERLDGLRSSKGKSTEILKFLRSSGIPYEKKIRFCLHKVDDTVNHVGVATLLKVLSITTNRPESKVLGVYWDYGEVGDVAHLVTSNMESTLLVDEVFWVLRIIPLLKTHDKIKVLSSLLSKATKDEAKWISRLAVHNLKLGISEKMLVNSVGRILGVDRDLLFEVCMTIGVLEALLKAPRGNMVLARYRLKPSLFVRPMLAYVYEPDRVRSPSRGEYKYDGARLQIHRYGKRFWLYSRRGIEKSETMPEVLEIVKNFRGQSFILDSEVIGVNEEGRILPFQVLHRRIGAKKYSEEKDGEIRLTVKVFDVLYLNGMNLMDKPLVVRFGYLKKIVPTEYLVDGRECRNELELMEFYQETLDKAIEGIMVKDLDGRYRAGERTDVWLKLKPERDTLDCVVVKAYRGKGHRAGWYSSFLLSVRDSVERKLYTVGRVSSLSNDQMIQLKDKIEGLKIREDRDGIFIKPSIVFEVTYGDIEESEEYSSKLALRFPKLVRIRDDKTPDQADTLDHLLHLFELLRQKYGST